MHEDLIRQYAHDGLIQFGQFQQTDGHFVPVALHFLLLPSYPEALRGTARALLPALRQSSPDRLLTTRAAIPLGAVVTAESGIPLTYPYGEAKAYTVAFTIEGAYDVGHPTALLTYVLTDGAEESDLIATAQKVGLHTTDVLCLFAVGSKGCAALENRGIRVHALFDMTEAVRILGAQNLLPAGMVAAARRWLAELE